MEHFKAILLRDYKGYKAGHIVEVAAGEDEYEGRWLVLRPIGLIDSWLKPLVDADRAITLTEAAHIFRFRRGLSLSTCRKATFRYIYERRLAPSGHPGKDIGATRTKAWFVPLAATWKMPIPLSKSRRKRLLKQQEADEAQKAS